jgi:hypothetical protein
VPISLESAFVRMLWYQRLPHVIDIPGTSERYLSHWIKHLAIRYPQRRLYHITVGASEMNDESPRLKTKTISLVVVVIV